MNQLHNYLIILNINAGVLAILVAIYAHHKKNTFSAGNTFIFISIFSAIYSFGYACELTATTLSEIKLWIMIEYLGLPFIAPTMMIFAFRYVGLERFLTRTKLFIVYLIPTLSFLLVSTNDFHHLFYRSLHFADIHSNIITVTIGPWYLVHGSYTFACLFSSMILFGYYWGKVQKLYRRQLIVLFLGVFIPTVTITIYSLGITPHGIDPVPATLGITNALYMWAIYSANMLVIAPVAKEKIFENMRDGVLVLDSNNIIIDFNRAAQHIFSNLNSTSIGKTIQQLSDNRLFSSLLAENKHETYEMQVGEEDKLSYYRVSTSEITSSNGKLASKIFLFTDITEQRLLQNKLQQLAITDALTGIYNRGYFMEKCEELLETARIDRTSLSFILFDIDFFKKVNDTYGHQAGDDALRLVVDITKQLLPENSIFCRYGGEEFALCLPGLTLHEASNLADTIRESIQATPLHIEERNITITASFGVVTDENAYESLDELLHFADMALYASKQNGRNTVHLFHQDAIIRLNKEHNLV